MPQSFSNRPGRDLVSRFRRSLSALVGAEQGRGQVMLVAFSGGPDSTALLHLLLETSNESGLTVAAAHLDHGLRGEEAERDLRAAGQAAKEAGVPFHWEKADCRETARRESLSIEAAARLVRYAFLARLKKKIGARWVATGHNADDQAEAVLLNLLRGSGPRGLSGIHPVRSDGVVRPLLPFWRSEIMEYLTGRGLTWVEDSSNDDQDFTRNRLRHDLIPKLEKEYNPSVKAALARTADILRQEEGYWSTCLNGLKHDLSWEALDGRVSLALEPLAGLDRAPARRVIREAVLAARGNTLALTLDHVDEVLDYAASGGRGGLDLPGGVRAWRDGDRLLIGRFDQAEPPEFEYELNAPGLTLIPELGLRLTAAVHDRPGELDLRNMGPARAALDLDSLTMPLRARTVRPGDRFRPLGMKHMKKLQDFFVDEKVPASQRPHVPLVLDQRGIVWVGGLRPSEDARLRASSTRALVLSLE